jgi:TP901 family phage tail tape measure protein
MTEETLKMARIAGIEYAEATDYMTAAIKGFGLAYEEVTHISDVYSNLAAKTATDTEEIAIAMSKVASIAHSTGMEMETTAAMLAQILEVTREAPETAGTALKTVIARFGEVKTLIEKGETTGTDEEGEAIDVNRIDAALKTAGMSLLDEAGQMRDLDDVLLELSSRWSGLSDMQ